MPTLSSLEEISIERNAEDEEREGSRETQEMQTVTVIEHGVGVDPHGGQLAPCVNAEVLMSKCVGL